MAHLVYDEDMIVNGMLLGKAPLSATTFAGKTGISDPQFAIAPEWPTKLRLNVTEFRAYQKAVFAVTDTYLASLKESDLDRELDMTSMGMGKQNVGWAFGMLIIGHANNLAGEISALKGVQGLKGYPF
jgi:DinB superfamily